MLGDPFEKAMSPSSIDVPRSRERMPDKANTKLPGRIDWGRHALFLDFDGTLAPIVHRPRDVVVSASTRAALMRLQSLTGGALSLLSGRGLDDLRARVAPMVCAMSGSHGLEIEGADGAALDTMDARHLLAQPLVKLTAFADRHGLLAEDKPGAVTVHYRGKPDLADDARSLVDQLAHSSDRLRAIHGHMVSEVALAGVDKGTALTRLMDGPPFAGRLPIMAGDDVTDEDAFAAASRLGGAGIKIGPGPTVARWRVADIEEFHVWLYRQAGLPQHEG